MTEHELQNDIISVITKRHGVVIRTNSGRVSNNFHGAKKGTSDLTVCYKGKFLAIEVKDGDKEPSDAQKEYGRNVNQAGGIFMVIGCMDTMIRELGMLARGER